jgi:hypothetical protein
LSHGATVRNMASITSPSVTSVSQSSQFSQSCRLPSNATKDRN